MFTGIVLALGRVVRRIPRGTDLRLSLHTGNLPSGRLQQGDSVAVNGVCLTALVPQGEVVEVDVSAETLRCTTLGDLQIDAPVNLEPALTLSTPLGGHLVSGHVDGISKLKARSEAGQSIRYDLEVPAELSKYIAVKGSICVDGVSLTVNEVQGRCFSVNLIPHTLQVTTLGLKVVGDALNVEVDLVARYVERLLITSNNVQDANINQLKNR